MRAPLGASVKKIVLNEKIFLFIYIIFIHLIKLKIFFYLCFALVELLFIKFSFKIIFLIQRILLENMWNSMPFEVFQYINASSSILQGSFTHCTVKKIQSKVHSLHSTNLLEIRWKVNMSLFGFTIQRSLSGGSHQ